MQVATATISIGLGLKRLTSATSLFLSGDSTKHVAVPGAGPSGGVLVSTMTFVDSKTVDLADAASTALSASSQMIAWGSDDSPAFAAFNSDARLASGLVTLNVPGSCYLASQDANDGRWCRGIPLLQVTGAGAALAGNFTLGAFTFPTTNQCSARIAAAKSGDTKLTLLSLADVPKFTAGRTITQSDGIVYTFGSRLKISADDLQGFGDPNHHVWEYAQQASIDAGTGMITLVAPVRNNGYLTTLPTYNGGALNGANATDCGGPATVYAFDASWDASITISGLHFYNPGAQVNASVKSVTFSACTWLNNLGPNPSCCETWTADACDASVCFIEVDKTVDTLNVQNGTTIGTLFFQSSSVRKLNCLSSTIGTLQGTPKQAYIKSSTIGTLLFGSQAYGRTELVQCYDSVVSAIGVSGAIDTDITANGFSIDSGVIKFPCGSPVRWAVPGTFVMFQGPQECETGFTVLGVFADMVPLIAVFSIAAGAKALSSPSVLWANADAGKPIRLENAGPGGNTTLVSTIVSVGPDGKSVMLADSAASALVAASGGAVWGYTRVRTTLTGSSFPNVPLEGGTRIDVMAEPCAVWFGTGNSGCADIVDLNQAGAQGKALFCYTNRSYTGNTLPAASGPRIWGRLVQIKITLSQLYTGTQSTLTLRPFGQFGVGALNPDNLPSAWDPVIDLKGGAPRTIIIAPTAVSGTGGADAIVPPGAIWFQGRQGPFSADVSGEVAGKWPIVAIEVETTRGTSDRVFVCKLQ